MSDENGSYNVPFLIPGTYSAGVEKEAFKKQTKTGIILQVDQKARVDFTLEVGAVTETRSGRRHLVGAHRGTPLRFRE